MDLPAEIADMDWSDHDVQKLIDVLGDKYPQQSKKLAELLKKKEELKNRHAELLKKKEELLKETEELKNANAELRQRIQQLEE